MELTASQQQVIAQFQVFLTNSCLCFLIEGPAGSGKTTVVQFILNYFNITKVVGVAYTHKAKRVLKQRMPNCSIFTLSSLLGKFKTHSYIGSKVFDKGNGLKISQMQNYLFILDEVSMVTDSDFNQLKKYVKSVHGKILAIGDACQIPAISQPLVVIDGMMCKKECDVFRIKSKYTLSEIVRVLDLQSPILQISSYVREHLNDDFTIRSEFPAITLTTEKSYSLCAQYLKQGRNTKIIAYTNDAVDTHNKYVRLELEFKDTFEVGDILTSYQNIGYPKIVLENGADYKVVSATKEKNGLRQGIVGYNLTLVDMDDELNKLYLFFPDVNAPENQTILSKLLELATKVNSYHSTPRDYAMYKSLKDKLMMITNVYEYPRNSSHFYSERELKDKEPLLFTVVNTVAGNKQLEEKLELLYGSIVKDRANDDKIVGEGETFASAFCIFEKDLDYGYACTAHKSQGSTMDTVFVDELNFDRMKNRINDRTGIMENKVKERNQLKYVAFTRASTELYIMV